VSRDSRLCEAFLAEGRAADCPVIDAHAHYGPYQGIYFPDRGEAESMLRMMDRAGIVRTVCAAHSALVDPERGHEVMAEVLERYPGRFAAYYCINPNYPEQARQAARIADRPGFVGYKFLSDYHRYPITGPNYVPALEYADSHHLPILFHTWGGSPFDGPKLWPEVAERYPNATLIMGHSGYGEWDLALELGKKYDNVYLELCAAYSVNGVVERMVREVGSHKVLYGEDLPWFDPHYAIGCVLLSHIADEDRHNILHRNAERIFGWGR
jgi:uncharacterized protein